MNDQPKDTTRPRPTTTADDAERETGAEPGGTPPADAPVAATEPVADEAAEFAAETARADAMPAPEEPDYKDRWLRAEAEIQNVRRRLAREREEAVRGSEERVLLDVIGLLDDLERALAALTPEQAGEAWAQGVALTAQRMRDALARHGVLPIAAVGQPFDPTLHEALLEIPAAEGVAPGHVAQEVQRGYRRDQRALRASRVVVVRAEG